MMHGRGKSDPAIGAVKPANKAAPTAAESVEQRPGAEGNASQQSTCRAQDRESVLQALERIRNAARQRKEEKFTSLTHHISIAMLRMAFFALRRDAAPGVDGLTWQTYEADLDRNLTDLHSRVHRGAYRALPSRRQYIPKADGQQRPIAIAALEDKLVQRATVAVLNAIYEEDFVGFSYGFRPRRGQHDALDALCVAITSDKVGKRLAPQTAHPPPLADSAVRSQAPEVREAVCINVHVRIEAGGEEQSSFLPRPHSPDSAAAAARMIAVCHQLTLTRHFGLTKLTPSLQIDLTKIHW